MFANTACPGGESTIPFAACPKHTIRCCRPSGAELWCYLCGRRGRLLPFPAEVLDVPAESEGFERTVERPELKPQLHAYLCQTIKTICCCRGDSRREVYAPTPPLPIGDPFMYPLGGNGTICFMLVAQMCILCCASWYVDWGV